MRELRSRKVKDSVKTLSETTKIISAKITKTTNTKKIPKRNIKTIKSKKKVDLKLSNELKNSISDNIDLNNNQIESNKIGKDNFVSIHELKTLPMTAGFYSAKKHIISIDPELKTIFENNIFPQFSIEESKKECDCFKSLCKGIIGQQVSGAAAKSIERKLTEFLKKKNEIEDGDWFPSPEIINSATIEDLRSVGLSMRKADYVKGLAEAFYTNKLSNDLLKKSSDLTVSELLLELKGIGEWSVCMFKLFGLKRLDVFAEGDLGIRRGVTLYAKKKYGENLDKVLKELNTQFEEEYSKTDKQTIKYKPKLNVKKRDKYLPPHSVFLLSKQFQPYRSVFMCLMWKYSATNIDVLTE